MKSSGVRASGASQLPAAAAANASSDSLERSTTQPSSEGTMSASLAGLSKQRKLRTNVNVIWTGKCDTAPVPYTSVPRHRSNVYFSLPLNAPRALSDASAACYTDMGPARYDMTAQTVLPGIGEIAPTLKPPTARRTEFDELFKRHRENRAMMLFDWARSAAYNPGHFSDIMRNAVQLSDLLDFERSHGGQGQTKYLDIDDMDNFRRLTQGVANRIARVADTDAIGGIRPDFERLSVDEMGRVLSKEGLTADTSDLVAIATYGAKAEMLLGSSPEEALNAYGIDWFWKTTREAVVQEFSALSTMPEARAFRDPNAPKHLPSLFSLAEELAAQDALASNAAPATKEARADAKIHVTRAMIFGPFRDALTKGTKFEVAAEQCGLDVNLLAAPMLAIAKQAQIQDLPDLPIREKSVAVWRYGAVNKQETTTDYLPHLRELKQRFQTDLSPEAQRKALLEKFTEPDHLPGLNAWEKSRTTFGDKVHLLTEGRQNTMSAIGKEGIASLEAVAYLMARNVFERHLPGKVVVRHGRFRPDKELAALHAQALERFDAIAKSSPVSRIGLDLERYLLKLRHANTHSSTAEWSRIGNAWEAASNERIAYARARGRPDITESAPDAVGDEKRQSMESAYRARADEMLASESAQTMMTQNRNKGILDDTGPFFFKRYADDIPNKVQLETTEIEKGIGHLFAVDPERVKSDLEQHDGSWM